MAKILVTGGAGYIGSHLCQAAVKQGYVPIVLDNLKRGYREAARFGPLEVGDATDLEFVRGVIKRHAPTAILHFAGLINVGESVTAPDIYYQNNTLSTLTLAMAAREFGIKNFIFSSTAAVYGAPKNLPILESSPLAPVNPYGTSKLMAEQILFDFAKAYGLKPVVLRYFNASGADPAGELGENHEPETHLIPLILQSLLYPSQGAKALKIFGNDYPTPDGTCLRDYIHVTDLACAHLLALKALEGGLNEGIFNLGNSQGFSVLQVIQEAQKVTGQKVKYQIEGRRAGDPPALVAHSQKARDVLGWTPKHSDLHSIISSAWNWEKLKKEPTR